LQHIRGAVGSPTYSVSRDASSSVRRIEQLLLLRSARMFGVG
jgi:hypothetical protein